MKAIFVLLVAMSPAIVQAQDSRRESLAREVDVYVRSVHEAAATFLNKRLPPEERIKAIEPHPHVYDMEQVNGFKSVVLDAAEPPEVRATALDKIVQHVPGDERLARLHLEWLANPQAPMILRQEALKVEGNLSFSSMRTPEVYQKMLDDPELHFRVFAFTKLVIHGDARAQQRLIAGLENPAAAALPAPTAIGILSMALKKEFYPAVYKVLHETKDPATRLEAIRALGFYPEARKELIAISRDSNERTEFREAALGALYAGDRDNIVEYVTPILSDTQAPPRLQSIGIQMTIDIRQSAARRAKATRADAYDRLVQGLARASGDADVRKVANKYLESVRPRY